MNKNINIFKYAAEHKMRFPFKGQINVEDLCNLSLNDLDTVYKTLKASLSKYEDDNDTLLDNPERDAKYLKEKERLEVSIAIVTEVFNDTKALRDKTLKAFEKNSQVFIRKVG